MAPKCLRPGAGRAAARPPAPRTLRRSWQAASASGGTAAAVQRSRAQVPLHLTGEPQVPPQRRSPSSDPPGPPVPSSFTSPVSHTSSPSTSTFVFSLWPVAWRKLQRSLCFCIRFILSLVLFFLLLHEYTDHQKSLGNESDSPYCKNYPLFPDLPFQPPIVGG